MADRGANLTFLALIAKACAENLAHASGGQCRGVGRQHDLPVRINVGIAVALDWGLIVPVIKQRRRAVALGIARRFNDLGERAAPRSCCERHPNAARLRSPSRRLRPVRRVPIINQPQVAILGVGAIEKRPKVVTGSRRTDPSAIARPRCDVRMNIRSIPDVAMAMSVPSAAVTTWDASRSRRRPGSQPAAG